MSDDIIVKFTNANILVNDKAYERIKNHENSNNFTDSLIEELSYSDKDIFVLTEEILDQFLKGGDPEDIILDNGNSDDLITSEIISKHAQEKFSSGRPFDFHVIQDTSKKSYTSGEIKDFSSYFKSRFEKLSGFLDKRGELKDHRPINRIRKTEDVVKIIGMVNDIINTKNNHKIIELEDETGTVNVLIHNENHKLFEMAELIVKDEVIGVTGSKKGKFVIASDLIHPGVPRIDEKPMDFSAVFISDVHIGSSTFLGDAFNKFVNWINTDFGDDEQIKIAEDVKYLVVAGDVVDGIGVYPHQEKELVIKNIYV